MATLSIHAQDFTQLGIVPASYDFHFRLFHADLDGITSITSWTVTTDAEGNATTEVPESVTGNALVVTPKLPGLDQAFFAGYPTGAVTLSVLFKQYRVDPKTLLPGAIPEAAWWQALDALQAIVDALPSGGDVISVAGRKGEVVLTVDDIGGLVQTLSGYVSDNELATFLEGYYTRTAVDTALAAKADTTALTTGLAAKANLASPTLTGSPKAPTAVAGTNSTQLATTAFVATMGATKADLVGGVIPTSQLPSLALVTAVTVANQAAMLALTAAQVQTGDLAIRTDGAGTFILTGASPSVLSNWTLLNAPTDSINSVNGQIGTVVLGKADIGLPNVDDTSDMNKPVSTQQQAALDAKADKVTGSAVVYATGIDGTPLAIAYSQGASSNTIARRSSGGTLVVSTPTATGHAATKQYVDDADALKLDKQTSGGSALGVYTTDTAGTQAIRQASSTTIASGVVVLRGTGGQITAPTPTAGTNAANKDYVDAADALNKVYVLGASDSAAGAPAGAIIARLPAV